MSGTSPGHIGTCVRPEEGCQTDVCALTPETTQTTHSAMIHGRILANSDISTSIKTVPYRHRITVSSASGLFCRRTVPGNLFEIFHSGTSRFRFGGEPPGSSHWQALIAKS